LKPDDDLHRTPDPASDKGGPAADLRRPLHLLSRLPGNGRVQLSVLLLAGALMSALAAGIVHVQVTEHQRMELAWVCDDHMHALRKGLVDTVGAVELLAEVLGSRSSLDQEWFRRLAASVRQRHPGLVGLAWLPQQGPQDLLAEGTLAAALAPQDARLGSGTLSALAQSALSSRSTRLDVHPGDMEALLVGVPVPRQGPGGDWGGTLIGLLGFQALSRAAIGLLEPRGIDLLLEDPGASPEAGRIGLYVSRLGSDAARAETRRRDAADRHRETFRLADRGLRLSCTPTSHYRSAAGFSGAPWLLLTGGLALTLVMAGLVWSLVAQVRERQRMEQALRASEQRLRVVFSQSPDIMMTVNERGRIMMVNRPWPKAPEESAIGRNSAKILPKGLRKWYRQALARVFASGSSDRFQYSATDSSCWQVRIVPLRNAGAVDAAMVIATDVTEHQLLEAQAIRSARLATLGVLAASVAHEINNPNNAIQFNATVLKRSFDDLVPLLRRRAADDGGFLVGGMPIAEAIDGLPAMLASVLRNSQRIQGIVASLKQMARHDPGEYAASVDLTQVLRSAYSLVQHQVQRCTDHCELLLPPVLPTLRGNPQQLEQVFINLLLNALQALPKRAATVRITADVVADGGVVRIAVIDQGCGIDDADLAKIFDPFYTTRIEEGGTGLGLSICRRIVQNHGGTIEIASERGIGTEVSVRLPVAGPVSVPGPPDAGPP